MLRRLRDRGLLEKQGSGSRTYYTLTDSLHQSRTQSNQTELPLGGTMGGNSPKDDLKEHATQTEEGCNLELATFVETLKSRSKEKTLREGIRRLCAWTPLTGDQLATLLGKDRQYLRNKHLIPMVRKGDLHFLYPESAKHPHQAYITSKTGSP